MSEAGEILIERDIPLTLEGVGDGWTVYGRAVPYDVDQVVSDDGGLTTYLERFAQGSFQRDAAKGGRWVNLMLGHSGDEGDRYLGRCVEITDEPDGLYTAFRLDRSHPQAEAARHGELTKWSVSAHVYRTRVLPLSGGQRVQVREYCGLSHVAATTSPQYAGAGVLVARGHELIVEAPVQTPHRDELRKRLDALRFSSVE
jgi:HK97 family phage prohead protease